MALKATLARCFILAKSKSKPKSIYPYSSTKPSSIFPLIRTFCTPSDASPKKRNPKLVNFSLPSDSDSDSETPSQKTTTTKHIDKSKLPPPYNPFSKKPAIEEPDDPKNLQEVFAKIREDGVMNSAAKMFDGLSQDGLTHEALELFSEIKDKGQMPDVVVHTAVMEAYVNAGQAKEAHKVYLRMLVSGVLPNAYTYRVVIRGLSQSGDVKMVKEARKYVGEMVESGMRPNAEICVGVFEGMVGLEMEDEGREMLEMVKKKAAVPSEEKVREALKGKRGTVYRMVMSVLFGK